MGVPAVVYVVSTVIAALKQNAIGVRRTWPKLATFQELRRSMRYRASPRRRQVVVAATIQTF